jgi:hypothetical protein
MSHLEETLSPIYLSIKSISPLNHTIQNLKNSDEPFTLKELFSLTLNTAKDLASRIKDRERPICSFYEEVEEEIRQGRIQQVGLGLFRFVVEERTAEGC